MSELCEALDQGLRSVSVNNLPGLQEFAWRDALARIGPWDDETGRHLLALTGLKKRTADTT
jgi:hypothetical protein